MFRVVSDLLLHKQLSFEENSIRLLGQNVVMFPFENLASIQAIICNAGKEHELYASAKELGRQWITNLFKAYNLKTIHEQITWGERVFSLAGLGKMNVVESDVDKVYMVYRTYDSLTAKHFNPSKTPVCHIPRGWFAGASSVFFGKDVDAVETKCMAKGDEMCEFLVQPKENFDSMSGLVKSQLKNIKKF